MKIQFSHEKNILQADLSSPIDISIPLIHHKSPIAFGAPPYEARPYKSGDFIGSLAAGSAVNFYNIKINPHGNCTHTESVLHIDERGKSILETLEKQHFVSNLITVTPEKQDNGDYIVTETSLDLDQSIYNNIEALIIRTTPNDLSKKQKNYTATNPIYFSPKLLQKLNETKIKHLLIDLPSVDKEQDEGKLDGHNIYWNTKYEISQNKTITELIYVDTKINDGLYLLNLQILPLILDVSPSRPVIYALNKV